MAKRVITDNRIIESSFFRGFVIQIKSNNSSYWHSPYEETTYDVLDSEWPNVYKTKEEAEKRLKEILNG